MFSFHCPVLDTTVLRGPRSLLSLRNTPRGIVASVRCRCGGTAVTITGQLAERTIVTHLDADGALVSAAPEMAAAECA